MTIRLCPGNRKRKAPRGDYRELLWQQGAPGRITKAGNRYLRQMLVVGAMAVIRHAERNGARRPWLVQLLARTATKHAAIALANKTARIVWALMTSGESYRDDPGVPSLSAAY